jgi:hypothetical protein
VSEADLAGKGWEIESSITLNQQLITSTILSGGQTVSTAGSLSQAPTDPSEDYLPIAGPDAGTNAGANGAGPDGGSGAAEGGASGGEGGSGAAEGGVSGGEGGSGAAEGGVAESADEVRADDIATLFAGIVGPNVRVTRIRGNIAHTAMTADLILQASADQSELSNVRNVTQSVNEKCPIYDGCNVTGTGTPEQAAASEKKSGCTASAQSFAASASGSGVLAGVFGLLLASAILARRRLTRRS